MYLTMLFPFVGPNGPVKALVTIVDIGIKEFAFAGNLSTNAGLNVLIALAFG